MRLVEPNPVGSVGKRREARSGTACLQGADFHIGDGESSEEAFNNPVSVQGWVTPPLPASEGSERDGSVCSSTSICSSSVSQQTKEGTIWESSQDVHTWALLSGGVDKTWNWRKYAS